MDEIKPLPEVFGTMDHLHDAVRVYCEMMKIFELDTKLIGLERRPSSGIMVKMLEEQKLNGQKLSCGFKKYNS